MGDWHFLGGILEEVHIHSTMIGKIWLTILFVFRMLVLGVAAEEVWTDEQAEFVCNTQQPGCRNVCYDLAFPISLIRYWVLQVIFVSSPSLVYMGHALYRLRALEKARQRRKAQARRGALEAAAAAAGGASEEQQQRRRRLLERELLRQQQPEPRKPPPSRRAPLRGSLLGTYLAHVATRSALEVAFMVGQYLLYGFRLAPRYRCQRPPCPHVVDCFVSRPTEKTLFGLFMQAIASLSLALSLLEIAHLALQRLRHRRRRRRHGPRQPGGAPRASAVEGHPRLGAAPLAAALLPPAAAAAAAAPLRGGSPCLAAESRSGTGSSGWEGEAEAEGAAQGEPRPPPAGSQRPRGGEGGAGGGAPAARPGRDSGSPALAFGGRWAEGGAAGGARFSLAEQQSPGAPPGRARRAGRQEAAAAPPSRRGSGGGGGHRRAATDLQI
ncbi:gap junction alpha-9 protein [Hemicordylus capensis]|uniref:gap junction alpha-9 protein n=1 Tax=Hemicordylus capensis TaxID=884348 RepID=UPI0023025844|nr:gap junction alpha-9 protein [Hemicordylus capensis]